MPRLRSLLSSSALPPVSAASVVSVSCELLKLSRRPCCLVPVRIPVPRGDDTEASTPPGGDASVSSPRGTGILTGTKQQGLRDSFNNSQETLTTLAADTGGKALLDSNDLSLGIRQAQQDINSYYIIGY